MAHHKSPIGHEFFDILTQRETFSILQNIEIINAGQPASIHPLEHVREKGMQAAQSLCKIVENSLVVFCCAFLGHKTIYKASQWHRASEIKGSKPVTAENRAASIPIAQRSSSREIGDKIPEVAV